MTVAAPPLGTNPSLSRSKGLEAFVGSDSLIEKAFNAIVAEKSIKLGRLAQPVRVAITGGTVSPGIFDVLEVMGKEKTVKRIEAAVSLIQS